MKQLLTPSYLQVLLGLRGSDLDRYVQQAIQATPPEDVKREDRGQYALHSSSSRKERT